MIIIDLAEEMSSWYDRLKKKKKIPPFSAEVKLLHTHTLQNFLSLFEFKIYFG